MRFYLCILFFSLIILSCSSEQSSEVLPESIKSTVLLYKDSLSHNHDLNWRKENALKDIFHNNINWLGIKVKYNSISEDLAIEKGIFLFTDLEILKTFTLHEVVPNPNSKTNFIDGNELSYYVKVKFKLIGKLNDIGMLTDGDKKSISKFTSFDKPIERVEYWIFTYDQYKKKPALIDRYPSSRVFYFDAREVLRNYNEYSTDKTSKETLKEVLLANQ